MDIATIIDAIITLGFPIVCCGALFWYVLKQDDKRSQETRTMVDAVNNNSKIIQKLIYKLDKEDEMEDEPMEEV